MITRDYDPDDIDGDEEDWSEEDDDDETMPCPHCLQPVYEDAEHCPNCGKYLSREDAPRRKPWWVVAGVVACLAVTTWWILHP
jgi:hypothetical protein